MKHFHRYFYPHGNWRGSLLNFHLVTVHSYNSDPDKILPLRSPGLPGPPQLCAVLSFMEVMALRVVLSHLPSPGLGSGPTGAQVPAEGLHHTTVPGRGLPLLLLPVVRE